MAMRNRNRRNSRRNGRPVIVQETMYATPVVEPANFVEVGLNSVIGAESSQESVTVTFGDIALACTNMGLSLFGASVTTTGKFRICSVVCMPSVGYTGTAATPTALIANTVPYDVRFRASGNHFSFSDRNKPLRIRLGKDVGDDGMWYDRNTGTTDLNPPAITSGNVLFTIDLGGQALPTGTFVTAEIRVRIAFTDRATNS